MTEKPEPRIEDVRLQFLLSIDRLLKASEEARKNRDLLFEMVGTPESNKKPAVVAAGEHSR